MIRGGQGDDDFLTGDDGSDVVRGQQDDDEVCGYDFLKSRDHVSGSDYVDGNFHTDTCVIDAGDIVDDCEL